MAGRGPHPAVRQSIEVPVLLVIGTRDRIGIEKADTINEMVPTFFAQP